MYILNNQLLDGIYLFSVSGQRHQKSNDIAEQFDVTINDLVSRRSSIL